MRLIDADALKIAMEKTLMPGKDVIMETYFDEVVQAVIDEAPTIEAEPVRHGQNVTYTHPADMFVCSKCGFTCEITELRDEDEGMSAHTAYEYDCKFCPDCGAKMDGGANGQTG